MYRMRWTLVQITLLQVFEKKRQFDPKRSLRGWLSSMITNKNIDHHRRNRHRQCEAIAEDTTDAAPPIPIRIAWSKMPLQQCLGSTDSGRGPRADLTCTTFSNSVTTLLVAICYESAPPLSTIASLGPEHASTNSSSNKASTSKLVQGIRKP